VTQAGGGGGGGGGELEQEFASFCARRKHDALGRGVVRPLPDDDVICQQVYLLTG